MITSLFCLSCGISFDPNFKGFRCKCGGLFDLNFSSTFPIKTILKRHDGLWKYREAIPIIHDENIISFNEGFTPLEKTDFYGLKVFIKHDYLFPSGSYKDRGSTVLLSKIKELGILEIIEDSSGNAGASIAAYSAKAGIKCRIFIPSDTSPSKILQIRASGGELVFVDGDREATATETFKNADQLFYASHVYNPYFFQGIKTLAFEICEQLGWKSPQRVFVPAGNGTLVIGVYKGFMELIQFGIIDNMPQIIAIQAENCAPLTGSVDFKETIAEGIAIIKPARISQILAFINLSKGKIITVSENEIVDSLKFSLRKGYYIEPTSATVLAGLKKFAEYHEMEGGSVAILTGSGLKASDKIYKLTGSLK